MASFCLLKTHFRRQSVGGRRQEHELMLLSVLEGQGFGACAAHWSSLPHLHLHVLKALLRMFEIDVVCLRMCLQLQLSTLACAFVSRFLSWYRLLVFSCFCFAVPSCLLWLLACAGTNVQPQTSLTKCEDLRTRANDAEHPQS